ncbi:MAG: SMODS domain-containing nucleotidyltransferase [Ramlibacter sp.]
MSHFPVNPQSPLAGVLAAMDVAATPKWSYVTKRFAAFHDNLQLTPAQEADAETKIQGVVSCLNAAYYGHNSATDNAFLIGSWAKGTRVRPPRDLDLYFLLPVDVHTRFEQYAPGVNKQSALLQEVKTKLLATNPTSSIKGDGPVVLAAFTSYSVEVVPAFRYNIAERTFYVCDTKNGGSYKVTMPLHEFDAIDAADKRNAGNVRLLVRMLKAWQAWCNVPIKSFHLELLAIDFMDQSPWRHKDFFYYDWISRDFFAWIITKADTYLFAPGTYELLWVGSAWKSRAEMAYRRAVKACELEQADDMANAGDEWQKVYGTDIPKWV